MERLYLFISTFQHGVGSGQQVGEGEEGHESNSGCARLDHSILVPSCDEDGHCMDHDQLVRSHPPGNVEVSSNGSEAEAGGSVDQLSEANPTTLFLIHNATRESTKTKYASIVRKWKQYCTEKLIPEEATTTSFANFVAVNFDRSLKYGTLRSYTAALQPYIRQVDRDVVSKLFKGVYNLRPPVPRYTAVWDVSQVLMYLAAMIVDNESDMTKRLATLLMLLSGNRVNMLSSFSIQHMTITENECTFRFDKVLKHSRPSLVTNP